MDERYLMYLLYTNLVIRTLLLRFVCLIYDIVFIKVYVNSFNTSQKTFSYLTFFSLEGWSQGILTVSHEVTYALHLSKTSPLGLVISFQVVLWELHNIVPQTFWSFRLVNLLKVSDNHIQRIMTWLEMYWCKFINQICTQISIFNCVIIWTSFCNSGALITLFLSEHYINVKMMWRGLEAKWGGVWWNVLPSSFCRYTEDFLCHTYMQNDWKFQMFKWYSYT